jgi:DnaJ-domain-containing protein 1
MGNPKDLRNHDIYKSKKNKETEYWDQYYTEKSWAQREKERREQFLFYYKETDGSGRDFNCGKHFHNDTKQHSLNKDIHPIFKINESSSEDDFKKAYRKLILKHHPDKGGEPSFFIKIQEAYENIKIYFSCS